MKTFWTVVKWTLGILFTLWVIGFTYELAEKKGLLLKTDPAKATSSGPAKITWEAIPTGEGTDRSPVRWWAPDDSTNPSKGKFTLQPKGGKAEEFDNAEDLNGSLAKYGWKLRPHQNPIVRVIKGVIDWFME
jgi:hypothetical protein